MAASDPERLTPVPPRAPLASEQERSPTRLHWMTAVLVMLINGVWQWGLVRLMDLVSQRSGSGPVVWDTGFLNLVEGGSTGLLVALGAVLADRVASPRRSRAARWAIGMGVTGVIASLAWLLPDGLEHVGLAGLGYALLGLLLGFAARSEQDDRWRLPLVGLVACTALRAMALPMALALPPHLVQWEMLLASLGVAPIRGALVGGAFAVGLALGRRQEQRDSPS